MNDQLFEVKSTVSFMTKKVTSTSAIVDEMQNGVAELEGVTLGRYPSPRRQREVLKEIAAIAIAGMAFIDNKNKGK